MTLLSDYRLPSLDALLAFEAAAHAKTFERAAYVLSVTSSALRKRISGLEQLLGVTLFNRQAGSITLTPQGEAYLAQITPVLEQLAAIPLHHRLTQRKQRLTVYSPPTFSRQILSTLVAHYNQTYPTLDLQIQLSAPLSRQIAGAWDISINGDNPDVGISDRLLDEQLFPLIAPGLLAKMGLIRQPTDFNRLPLLRSSLEPWQPWFQRAGLELMEPDTGPDLLDLGMLLEAAALGQGVVLARPSLALPWLSDGSLVPVLNVGSTPSYHYEVHIQQPSAAASTFVAELKQICLSKVMFAKAELHRSFEQEKKA